MRGVARISCDGRITLPDFWKTHVGEAVGNRPISAVLGPNSPILLYSELYSASFPRLGILGYLLLNGDSCYLPSVSATGESAVSYDGTPHQDQWSCDLRWSGRLNLPPGPFLVSRNTWRPCLSYSCSPVLSIVHLY